MEDKLYYSIGEVAEYLGVNPSLLRFWEKEFKQLKPRKSPRGTRTYTKDDIALLARILYLTRDCGFTLEGAREQLDTKAPDNAKVELIEALKELRAFLEALKDKL